MRSLQSASVKRTLRASRTVRRVGKISLTMGKEVTGFDNLQQKEKNDINITKTCKQ